jgi:hypothetical protein
MTHDTPESCQRMTVGQGKTAPAEMSWSPFEDVDAFIVALEGEAAYDACEDVQAALRDTASSLPKYLCLPLALTNGFRPGVELMYRLPRVKFDELHKLLTGLPGGSDGPWQ